MLNLNLLFAILLLCSTAYCSFTPPVTFGNTIRDIYAKELEDMVMMASQWTVNGSIPDTKGVNRCYAAYLGGFGQVASQGSFKRLYTMLPTHNVVDFSLDIRVLMMENLSDLNLFRVKIDDIYFQTFVVNNLNGTLSHECSSATTDFNMTLTLMGLAHSSSTITIEIFWEVEGEVTSLAIRDLVLSFHNSDSPGTNNCPTGFYNNNGACEACDPACQNCFGPSSTQCFPCQMGSNLIGNECVECPSDCSLCSGPDQGQCLLCKPGYTLDFDGTCIFQQTCNSSPYVFQINRDAPFFYLLAVCARSCPDGETMLPDRTCIACDFPLQEVTRDDTLVCESPCGFTESLYINGSCGNCPAAFGYRSVAGFQLCYPPCGNLYFHPNQSCIPTCDAPYVVGEDYYAMKTCVSPCSDTQYLYPDGSCQNNCSLFGYQTLTHNSFFLGNSSECIISYCEIHSTTDRATANCTNPSNDCPSDMFLYPDGHCEMSCDLPEAFPYTLNFNAYCVNSTVNPNNQTNRTATVSLQLYIRYDMSLNDFNSQHGLSIYIQQLARILGVDSSDIIITDVREGSTIIESQVILTTESDQDSMNTAASQAQTMSQRFSSAISSRQLNIFAGVEILDSRPTVQVSTPSAGEQVSSHSSNGKAIGIGVGAGIGALFVLVGGFFMYRHYRARKGIKSAQTNSDRVRVRGKQNGNDQEANDDTNMRVRNVSEQINLNVTSS